MINNKNAFTLVELLVVLLIIGILMSVATVVFMKARTTGQDSGAKQILSNTTRAIAGYYIAEGKLPENAEILKEIESAYIYVDDDGIVGAPEYDNPPKIEYDPDGNKIRTTSASGKTWAINIADGEVRSAVEE